MKYPSSPVSLFKERRQKLIDDLKDHEAVILPSKPVYFRQTDITYPYRQDSFFYYLTGFEEPHSCLILKKGFPCHILFVQENIKAKQQWEGPCFGPSKAKEVFDFDQCEKITQFEEKLSSFMEGISSIYYAQSIHPEWDQKIKRWMVSRKTKNSSKKYSVLDIKKKISQMRLFKDPDEIEKIKKACEISAKAHREVMQAVRTGINERHLHGIFLQSIMRQNAERESYPGIFASGENALILHYTQNDQLCRDGDMILVDAGAEWEYYASDITRTFPVNGRFSPAQKVLYNHVLDAQKKIIDKVGPGISFKSLQRHTQELCFELLKKENILQSKHTIKDVQRLFPHNVGHFLGLDVHDVGGGADINERSLLKPGMVITIEPGVYIPKDDQSIPEPFRGIGIRIEDNILVTEKGCQNLSLSLPKEAEEIEALMAVS